MTRQTPTPGPRTPSQQRPFFTALVNVGVIAVAGLAFWLLQKVIDSQVAALIAIVIMGGGIITIEAFRRTAATRRWEEEQRQLAAQPKPQQKRRKR